MQRIIDQITSTLGHQPPQDIQPNGRLHYFSGDNPRKKQCWARVYENTTDDGNACFHAYFGNYKYDSEYQCSAGLDGLSKKELKKIQKNIDEKREQHRQERLQQIQEVKELCKHYWDSAIPYQSGHYPESKCIDGAGTRIGQFQFERKQTGEKFETENNLLIPIYDIDGFIGVQVIWQMQNKEFKKHWPKGIKKRGSFARFGEIESAKLIYVCEGYATGASIHQCINDSAVVCAMDAGNLIPVIQVIRKLNPDCYIIVAADDDAFTTVNGKPVNKGIEVAEKATKEFTKVIYRKPEFVQRNSETDFNDLFIQEGADAIRNILDFDPTDEAQANMIRPLGHFQNKFFYFSPATKEVIELAPSAHNKYMFMSMEEPDYWLHHYKINYKTGEPDYDHIAAKLMKECRFKGHFTPDKRRGRGAWLDNGRLVFNFGEELLVDGEIIPMFNNGMKSKYFYEPTSSTLDNYCEGLDDSERKLIVDAFKLLPLKNQSEFIYILGWAVTAHVFGAIDWVPHIWLIGERGCGKTTVQKYLNNLILYSKLVEDATAAGIRQNVQNNATPMIYDEAEADSKKMASIIQLARQCSSNNGSETLRGTIHGKSIGTNTNLAFCFGSIQQGAMTAADESRIIMIEIERKDAKDFPILNAKMHQVGKLKNKFFSHVLNNFSIFEKNISILKEVLKSNGIEARQVDQIAPMIAGYHLIADGGEINEKFISQALQDLDFANSDYAEVNKETDSEKCLNELLGTLVDQRQQTVQQVINNIRHETDPQANRGRINDLAIYGLKYYEETNRLFVALSNRHLKNKMIDYPAYANLLKRYSGFQKKANWRIDGRQTKGIVIQLDD